MKAIASTGVSYIRDDLNAGSWLHINALIRLPTPGIEIIPNVRYARRRDSLHHRIRRPTLFEMCGEPKPVVTSVRCYAPDRNTQYRQKLQNLHNVQSFLRRSFRDGAIFYLLGRAISGDSQDFGDGGGDPRFPPRQSQGVAQRPTWQSPLRSAERRDERRLPAAALTARPMFRAN